EEYGDVGAWLRTEFAAEGGLQLRRALEEKDEQALEALTLRYHGTDEAAEALLWLGDRHLVDGEPALAVGRYRQALRMTGATLRQRLDDRLQLTAALLGQPLEALPETDITFGEMRLSPAVLQALRKRRGDEGVDSRGGGSRPPQLAPVPTMLDMQTRGRFEGELGDRPEAVPALLATRYRPDIDWFARQLALAVDGNRLYASNRFQVDCCE